LHTSHCFSLPFYFPNKYLSFVCQVPILRELYYEAVLFLTTIVDGFLYYVSGAILYDLLVSRGTISLWGNTGGRM
jgi:hypothetical protein